MPSPASRSDLSFPTTRRNDHGSHWAFEHLRLAEDGTAALQYLTGLARNGCTIKTNTEFGETRHSRS